MLTVLSMTVLATLASFAAYKHGQNQAKAKLADTIVTGLLEAQADIDNHSTERTQGIIWLAEYMKKGF